MMQHVRRLLTLLISGAFSTTAFGQDSQRNFSDISQTYYLKKDRDLVGKTISFLNETNMNAEELEPLLTGFFGALFTSDPIVKKEFSRNLGKINKPELKNLFVFLIATPIDSIYAKVPLSPTVNDMNWGSYFATGDTRFLDSLISTLPHAENRNDIALFLTGATAKWSLSSNASQHANVKQYLLSLQDKNPAIKDLLYRDPAELYQGMIDVLKEQKSKGIWDK